MATFCESKTTELLDKETGEIITIETSKTWRAKVKHVQEFYMVFVDWISLEYQIKSSISKSILTWMLVNAEYNTGKVRLTTEDRAQICKLYQISNNALSTRLKELKDLSLITGQKGIFYLNPELFWKGEISARNQILQEGNIKFTISIERD